MTSLGGWAAMVSARWLTCSAIVVGMVVLLGVSGSWRTMLVPLMW